MHKKAQGLSLDTIVIAAIVLVVLVILVLLLTGYFPAWAKNFNKATETRCSALSGTPRDSTCQSGENQASGFFEDVKEGQVCCLKKSSEQAGSTPSATGGSEIPPEGALIPPSPQT